MKNVLKNINRFREDYLIIDGTIPIVTNSSVINELTLYNLSSEVISLLFAEFTTITGKMISPETDTNTFSYGQKIIFSVLCSIFCPAGKVQLRLISSSIDGKRMSMLNAMISLEQKKGRQFLFTDE